MSVEVEVELDFARLGSMTFTLTETGGGGATGSISITSADGPYFLRTDASAYQTFIDSGATGTQYSDLLSALKTKLDAVGNATYTVSFNTSTQRITISASGGSVTSFAMTSFNTVAQQVLGYTANKSGALTFEADRAPYYWIQAEQGGLADYSWDQEEDADIAFDNIAHDGTAYGISKPGAPVTFRATIPMEPKEIVQEHFAVSTVPYTWQRFFGDARNVLAYVLKFSDTNLVHTFILRNRADGALFRPRLTRKDWWDYSDIQLDARVLNSSYTTSSVVQFAPTDVSGLQLWLEPTSIQGTTPITAWNDSSGNGRHFSTVTSSPQKTTVAGNYAVEFDGTDDRIASTATLANIIQSDKFHVFVVCKPSINFTDVSGILNAAICDNAGYWAVGGWSSGGNKVSVYNYDGSVDNASQAYTSNNLVLIECAHTSGNLYLRSATTSSAGSIVTQASGNTSLLTGTLRVGADYALTAYFKGTISEIAVFNATLSTGNQASMREYYTGKYGIVDAGVVLY